MQDLQDDPKVKILLVRHDGTRVNTDQLHTGGAEPSCAGILLNNGAIF